MKKFLRTAFCSMVILTLMNSCTISEPKEGSDGNRLESITNFMMTFYSVKYDGQGRIIELNDQFSGGQIKISYSPLTITEYELDTYSTDDNEYKAYVSNETVYSNISLNTRGFITSYEAVEKGYYWDYYSGSIKPSFTDIFTGAVSYDNGGHILSIDTGDDDVTYFSWKNGNLVTSSEFDSDINEIYVFEYSGVPNKARQWVPWWISPMFMTGLFGVAPSEMITAGYKTYGDYEYENTEPTIQFAYKLHPSGKISSMQINDYGDIFTMNFNYSNGPVATRSDDSGTESVSFKKIKSPFRKHNRE